ncbi:HlyD family efflux transporter periplasmic adaptor subunit [Rhizobium cauense]|uniref:HlyD family secretion protein n=1 Tax=Rhizobium cauense TaxID=1166683 RepID=UPI001C6EAE91|nr:HlyD family efflux transporter periplasmic adaptor subunit [Rhizobium cauense]MBW9114100.1 HlyD family efflux transporter periplasmic adaptor subunit [Rhizobium cauense]
MSTKNWVWIAALAVAVVGGYFAWQKLANEGLPAGIASGNGRIEATEIDISTKTAGRIQEILVNEGAFVKAGEVLARMDTEQLDASLRQAEAQLRRAAIGIDTANSLVKQREAEQQAAIAVVTQREAESDAAAIKYARSMMLLKQNTISQQILDDDKAAAAAARATVAAAQAQLAAAEAAIAAAQAQVVDAEAAVDSAKAQIESIKADLADSVLTSPRDGRVQYRVAQPGEVLAAGGRVLNIVDLSDVYMTFFLPTEQAGKVAYNADVRIVLDAAPSLIIPAKVSYVAAVAQFTPKTVETHEERQKLMFRIKAQIPQELLRKYIDFVKTGLPGMAYVKLDPQAQWPANVAGAPVQ